MKAMTLPPVDKVFREAVEFGQEFAEAVRAEAVREFWRAFEYLNIPTPSSLECLREQIVRLRTAIGDPQQFFTNGAAPIPTPITPMSYVLPPVISARAEIIAEPSHNGHATLDAAQELEPLPGYHAWNVKTAVAALSGLDAATLIMVRSYEEAHGKRITVLRAIEKALEEPS